MRRRDQSDPDQSNPLLRPEVRYRSFAKLLLMVLNICMSPFYFGYTIQYLGTFQFSGIMKIFHIDQIGMSDQTAKGIYNACVPIGAGVGALTSFLLLKYLSRKYALLAVNCIAIAFGLLLFVKNPWTFLLARVMQGVCVGFYSAISPLIIKELSPNEISGTMGAFNQLFVAFGVFFACLLQFILKRIYDKQEDYWFVMFGFTLITVVLQTLLLLIVYRFQTPKYLLENRKQQQCRQVLKWIYLDQYVQQVMNQKKTDLGLLTPTKQNKQSVVSADSIKFQSIQKKRNNIRFGVAIHLAILQQFVGINAVVIYGTDIAKQVLTEWANLIPVILNLEQTLTSLLTSYLLTRLGRKQILQVGTIVSVISLVMIGIGFFTRSSEKFSNFMIIGGLVVFMANFGLSLGPIVWLYIPEILEPSLIPFSTGANWATATLITLLFPILKEAFGNAAYLFLFYAVYSAVGFAISQKFVIQTKGKSEKQIYRQYDQMSS